MRFANRLALATAVSLLTLFWSVAALSQTEAAAISGRVADPSGAAVVGAKISAINNATNVTYSTQTNGTGFYNLPGLIPGTYRVIVEKEGFAQIVKPDVQLHVQDNAGINFSLQVGSVTQSVTVEGGVEPINTENATVSTVVDRNFAENLPMNGRSFQTLIQLTPGVVLTTSNFQDSGQFSVNGQRASSNYWMVDGVSANVGVGAGVRPGNGTGGASAGFSVLGGTNNLVSVDALQEFRIQTSTFAPEFGRTPGGQISIVTRAGTNQWHGTAFDYLRNDLLDASDWFNGYTNNPPLRKAEERQNDFGGTFGGPILKDRTFFFFSYEGFRLRLPQTALTTVPDASARQSAIPAIRPFFNAFPLDPNQPNLGNGIAQFNASFSNRSSLDAASLRVDHKLNEKIHLFARYNYSPSQLINRGGGNTLSNLSSLTLNTHTATGGATWAISPLAVNDVRVNYSRMSATNDYTLDSFGGAVPLGASDLPLPSPYTPANSVFTFANYALAGGFFHVGPYQANLQRQFNIVDGVSVQQGLHTMKFGADYRRLTPIVATAAYQLSTLFYGMSSAESGLVDYGSTQQSLAVPLVLQETSVFAQDTWRVCPNLTLAFGLRWDVDLAPKTSSGPGIPAIMNFNDPSTIARAPAGTPAFHTGYGNLAPRIGVAYQFSQRPGWERTLRGGWGVFFDLPTAELGNLIAPMSTYPFGAVGYAYSSWRYPLDPARVAPPAISSADPFVSVFDPKLKLPRIQQWNIAFEQSLSRQQSISVSYIGAIGRRLMGTEILFRPNPSFITFRATGNYGTSDYHALQLQFQRRLSHGLQALASYTWAHSIDTGSASSGNSYSNYVQRNLALNVNRGPSDFDIRHAGAVAITYDVSAPKVNALTDAMLRSWSFENVFQVRSAPPVDVNYYYRYRLADGSYAGIRPDVVPGIPLYLYGSRYPGGKAFNYTPGAVTGGCPDGSASVGPFCPPQLDPVTHQPVRQGDLGRNALTGFGAWQWDLAVHREFPIRERLALQFRAELFNVLNHPNFGSPSGSLVYLPTFGRSTQMLGASLNNSNTGGGALNALYQMGGPRSVQLALKLRF